MNKQLKINLTREKLYEAIVKTELLHMDNSWDAAQKLLESLEEAQ